jgi:hypothetical protein
LLTTVMVIRILLLGAAMFAVTMLIVVLISGFL